MNKIFLALAVISLGFFSSCNKCKDKTCQNSASCDKKTGDCSNVCVNGGTSSASTRACSCTEFYDGGTCSNEIRNDLQAAYSGTLTFDGSTNGTVATVSNNGTEATGQAFSLAITYPGNLSTTLAFKGVLSAKDSVTFTDEQVPFTYPPFPSIDKARVSGSGYYVNGKFEGTLRLVCSGGSTTITYSNVIFKGVK